MTRQQLLVILCRLREKGRKETDEIVECLPEKERKKIDEIVEEMKERDREERRTGMKVKKQKKIKHSPSTLTCYKDNRPCPIVSPVA